MGCALDSRHTPGPAAASRRGRRPRSPARSARAMVSDVLVVRARTGLDEPFARPHTRAARVPFRRGTIFRASGCRCAKRPQKAAHHAQREDRDPSRARSGQPKQLRANPRLGAPRWKQSLRDATPPNKNPRPRGRWGNQGSPIPWRRCCYNCPVDGRGEALYHPPRSGEGSGPGLPSPGCPRRQRSGRRASRGSSRSDAASTRPGAPANT